MQHNNVQKYSWCSRLHGFPGLTVKNEVDSHDTFKKHQDHIIQRLLPVSQLGLTVFNWLRSSPINKTVQINILDQINKLQMFITVIEINIFLFLLICYEYQSCEMETVCDCHNLALDKALSDRHVCGHLTYVHTICHWWLIKSDSYAK